MSADVAQTRPSAYSLVAAAYAFVALISFSPAVESPIWTPKAAALVAVTGVGLPLLFVGRDRATWAARALVVVAAASALLATRPGLAVIGQYSLGTGLIFVLGLAAAWALGARVDAVGKVWLERAILAGVGVNLAVAVAEMAFNLEPFGFGRVFERSPALQGNPVYASTLFAAALALVAARVHRAPWRWLPPGVALCVGLSVAGGRGGILLGALVAAGSALTLSRRAGALMAACLVVGLAAGSLIEPPVITTERTTGGSVTGRPPAVATNLEGRPLSPRLTTWWAARLAVARNPLLGAGPGQFRAATVRDRPLVVARDTPDKYFTDAHNLAVEYAVTTGVLGLFALGAFGVFIVPAARGPLGGFALVALLGHLVQPQHIALTPLVFLALGAAGPTLLPPKAWWPTVPCVAAALAAAVVLLLGDFHLRQARLDFTLSHARSADRLLRVWPQPAVLISRIHRFREFERRPHARELALAAARQAVARDPDNPVLWNILGDLATSQADPDEARRAYRRALALDRWSVRALTGMADLANFEGDTAEAKRWFERVAFVTQR